MRPIADAVTEVQVQTGSTSAEYGSYLGVHVNVVTKSGTNDLHGTLLKRETLDVRIGQDVANTGHMPRRPDLVGTPTENCGEVLVNCISADAFRMPAPFTYGNTTPRATSCGAPDGSPRI